MDAEKAGKLLNWLKDNKFHPSEKYIPGKGYFLSPLLIYGHTLSTSIRFQKVDFALGDPDVDLSTKFATFQRLLVLEDNLQILATLESSISSVEYGLVYKQIKSFVSRMKTTFNPFLNEFHVRGKESMQIWINPRQSVLELLETLLIPNINIVSHFAFLVPQKSPAIYAALWLIIEALRKSNLSGVTVKLQEESTTLSSFTPTRSYSYPPTLAVVLDDADVFSSVDRLIDMISGLPIGYRKVDIWIEQSAKKLFADKFNMKLSKSTSIQSLSESVQLDAINPILTLSDDQNEMFIKLLTFRKTDELIGFINRYQMIRGLSLWTSNISKALEIVKTINSCHIFTINTFNEPLLTGHYNFLHHSKTIYQLLGESTFQSYIPLGSLTSVLSKIDYKSMLKGSKSMGPVNERFSSILSILSQNRPGNIDAINLVRMAHLNHSTFKQIEKCLMLQQSLSLGMIIIHFDKIDKLSSSRIMGLIASILLYGNSCIILTSSELPEPIKGYIGQFKSVLSSNELTVVSETMTIPYGWIYNESEPVGLSFGINYLANLINFANISSLIGYSRSVCFPDADQLSLKSASASSGY